MDSHAARASAASAKRAAARSASRWFTRNTGASTRMPPRRRESISRRSIPARRASPRGASACWLVSRWTRPATVPWRTGCRHPSSPIRAGLPWAGRAGVRLKASLLAALPFRLTLAQTRALREIEGDLKEGKPMLRLVQGDVGCGKTLVAALAATQAVQAGRQAALMAPTELLADQHAQNFRRWFEPLGVAVALLTGRQNAKARSAVLQGIRAGHAPIVVGTHALFQESVEFAALALVIVDEQHRFGVHQRLSLREKGAVDGRQPHQLIMTATPIPRTLAMTAYADLDVSVIDELPPGRTPVKTVVLTDSRRDEVVQRIRTACLEGRQAYWVCPLIDESEEMPYQAAEETAASLAAALPELAV